MLLYLFREIEALVGIDFRIQIISVLSIADLIIANVIWKRGSLLLSLIFFVNPISIIITGYHNQFDNLAIAIFLVAVLISPAQTSGPFERRELILLGLLSLSLIMKHVFLVYVFWLAVRQKQVKRQIVYLLTPPFLFALSFLPFQSSWSRITDNASGWSADNGPLWTLIGLEDGLGPIPLIALSILVLASIGVLVRNWSLTMSVFLFLVVLVITTPNSAGQYFAIAVIGAIGLGSPWFVPYVAIATYVLMLDYHGLHFSSDSRVVGVFVLDTPVLTEGIARFGLTPLALMAGCIAVAIQRRSTRLANSVNQCSTTCEVGSST
jgi:hypothetical protein